MKQDDIPCVDGCKRSMPADKIEGSGWEYLPIQRRYRCVDCWRQLRKANGQDKETGK